MSKWINGVALVMGVSLLTWLVLSTGPEKIWNDISSIKYGLWGILIPVACYTCATFWEAVNLYFYLGPGGIKGNIGHVFLANMAGQAINQLTPTGGLGGEAVKGTLLANRASSDVLTVALVLYNLSFTLISLCIILLGPCLILFDSQFPMSLRLTVLGIALLFVIPVGALFWFVRRGAAKKFVKLLKLLRLPVNTEKLTVWAEDVDQQLRTFKKKHRRHHRIATFMMVLSRLHACFEVWAIMWLLNHPVSFREAILIMSLSQILYWCFAFVPGQMGVAEGGQQKIFTTIFPGRFGPEDVGRIGLNMEIIRRVRKLILNGLGILCMLLLNRVNARYNRLNKVEEPESLEAVEEAS